MSARQTYMADVSLALVNRTGAYYICRDVLQHLPQFFPQTRYWRLGFMPQQTLLRKIAARAMMQELYMMGDSDFLARAHPKDKPVFFMDPLYVLRTELKREDIVLVHDVGPVSHADLFPPEVARLYRLAYEKIARVNPGLLTVSDFSYREYRRLYGTQARFHFNTRLYVREGIVQDDVSPVAGVNTPFLLTIGALEKRKNHVRMFEAYRRSGLYAQGVSYVFCGARGYGADEIMEAARATPGVIALGYVSDAELRWLFRNASGMALASLLEGFGLPPLEAAQQGLVSLVSAGGAQEEAVGDGGILVDPTDTDAIAEGMRQLLALSPEDKADKLEKCRAHAATMQMGPYLDMFARILAANDAPDAR